MMTAKVQAMVMIGALMVFVCGCSGRIKYPSYYTLSIAPAVQPSPESAQPSVTIAVQRFITPPYLRQGRIVYRESPNEVNFYEYHRWASDLGAAITTALVEGLRSPSRIALEEPAYNKDQSDYVLSGKLEELDEIDFEGEVKVAAKVSAKLKDSRTGFILWSGGVHRETTVDRRDVDDVARQMSNALQASVNELLGSVEKTIAEANEAKP